MSDELTMPEGMVVVEESQQAEPIEADAGTATDIVPEQEESQESAFNQEAVNKRIGKITAEKYAERAEKEAAIKKAAELEQRLREYEQSKASAVSDIKPPSPDLYYEDPEKYAREVAEFNAKLVQATLQRELSAQRDAESRKSAEQREIESTRAAIERVMKSAEEAGIPIEELDKSAGLLASRGISPVLNDLVAQHERSAALIDYLAKNPAEFEEVNSMSSPLAVLRKLDSLQSSALKRKISNAPEPSMSIKGGSAREPDEFEKRCPGAKFI